VQEWIETDDHPDSGFGLATSDGEQSEPLVRYGRQAQGIDLVSGKHAGRDSMDAPVRTELSAKMRRFEEHFRHPVEIEYAVERGKIWMLQIRRAQLRFEDEIRWAAQKIREGHMTREEAVTFLGGHERLNGALNEPRLFLSGDDEPIVRKRKAAGGPWSVPSPSTKPASPPCNPAACRPSSSPTTPTPARARPTPSRRGGHLQRGQRRLPLGRRPPREQPPACGGIPVTIDRHARTVRIAATP
jgi:hypothetical protein